MSETGVRKVVILARGLGRRMRTADPSALLEEAQRQAADSGLKALIPVGRPFLDYLLSSLADAGYRHACLVIGPGRSPVRDYYGKQSPPRRLEIRYAVQEEPLGTADAVAAAEAFAGGDRFLAVNSDNLYPDSALRPLRSLNGAGVALFERQALLQQGNFTAERLSRFGAAEVTHDGFLARVLEKPGHLHTSGSGRPAYISMNCWLFTPVIFESCRAISPSARGELEITDAVQHAIDALGERFQALVCREGVLDMTSRADIPAVTRRLQGIEARP